MPTSRPVCSPALRSHSRESTLSRALSVGALGVLITLAWSPSMRGESTTPATVSTPISAAPSGSASAASTGRHSCVRCHTFDSTFNHPIDVRPSMSTPAHLPLDEGRLTCLTCHTQAQHTGRTGGPMLRTNMSAGSFCTQCHEHTGTTRAKMHASGAEKAHFRPKSSGITASRNAARLDEESVTCMSCHDGTTALDAGSHSTMQLSPAIGPSEHPVGISYPMTSPRDSERRLIDAFRLDKRVRLFDQTVGCGSCHSVYSGQDHLLVMSNQRSSLCLSCHIQ